MKKTSKQRVSDFVVTFKQLPETNQEKLLYIAYGMQLATTGNGGAGHDRAASTERVASVG